MNQNDIPQAELDAVDAPSANRKPLFAALAGVVVVAAAGAFAYEHFIGSRYVSTDNAYTSAEVADITPAITALVKAVNVTDTQTVRKGDVLVVLDDTNMRLALAQAEAEVSRAERRVQGYLATNDGFSAQIAARGAEFEQAQAQLASAQSDLERAQLDLSRRQALARSGSVSGEELSNAQAAFTAAKARRAAAAAVAQQAQANRLATAGAQRANAVLINGTTVDTNPEVLLARAKRDQARVDLERTVLRAPVDGVVAKRAVQVGQQVSAGTELMAVVPSQEMHVDANFKEGQLARVRIGQPVELKADLYGGSVVYHGVVQGLAGGTGSAFAAIPAQNATGNWIKVVQRVPVRIALDPKELAANPLQVGLSMDASIDTRADAAAEKHAQATTTAREPS
jgi:membrane fusion protein (multidrug efflux system)